MFSHFIHVFFFKSKVDNLNCELKRPKLFINILYKAKWSKYPSHSSKLGSHLNIDNSEIFNTKTCLLKQRYDQVPAGNKHHLPIIIHPPCL